ncbi:hypothetical protein [Nocardia alni]|uniref:hypothetical protein n=1 Tax=Nocardia alni TaxID=2815723 RepID=UPI001C21B00F|nr:hypothetical protein [Nocardia alni]
MMALDGVTIIRRLGGGSDAGLFDGYEEISPGDPGYDELLPTARENPIRDEEPERPVDPLTMAQVLRDAGLDSLDVEDS